MEPVRVEQLSQPKAWVAKKKPDYTAQQQGVGSRGRGQAMGLGQSGYFQTVSAADGAGAGRGAGNDEAHHIGVMISGHAEISTSDNTGTRTVIAQLAPGDVFGVMSRHEARDVNEGHVLARTRWTILSVMSCSP